MDNPLDLTGPEFLGLYITWLSVALVLALLVRWLLREPSGEPFPGEEGLDAYDAAYLAGGPLRAVDAAMAALVQSGALAVDAATRTVKLMHDLPAKAHTVEEQVGRAVDQSAGKVDGVRRRAASMTIEVRDSLTERGFLVSDGQGWPVRLFSALPVLAMLGLGVAKIAVGLSRGRPVGFLVVLAIVTALLALVLFFGPPHRSRRGDWALRRFRDEQTALKYAARSDPAGLGARDVALAVGLYGTAMLGAGPLADLHRTLTPPTSAGGGDGGGGCGGGGGGCGGCGS